jgi:uncharacterized protein RhaS with RHS repeats
MNPQDTNHQTTYGYTDYNAYLSSITYPTTSGVTHGVSYNYNPDGQLASSIDQNGQPTHYYYTANGQPNGPPEPLDRLTNITYPDTGSTTYSYSNVCGPTQTTIALSSSSNYVETATPDGVCNITQKTIWDPEGNDNITTTYDGSGQVRTVSNWYRGAPPPPANTLTTYSYDPLGRTTSTSYPDGTAASTSYLGTSSTVTDAGGKTRTLVSDELGRLSSVTEDPYGLNYPYPSCEPIFRG